MAIKCNLKSEMMNIIEYIDPIDISDILDALWATGRIRVTREPLAGMVMFTLRDSFGTDFHVGEVLMTQAEVSVEGQPGYGAVIGNEPEKSLLLAAIEALEKRDAQEDLQKLADWLDKQLRKNKNRAANISRLAAATRVQFESMQKERVDFGSLGE
jgi:alpha-D-ribose 1-methylphosphonate 5-triphosphate synthase subunit PhnG